MTEPKEYTTRDKPAERGITINNILLTLVVVGGSIFGTVVTQLMSDLRMDVKDMKISMSEVRLSNGVTQNEITHIHQQLDECKELHKKLDIQVESTSKRLNRLEIQVFRGHDNAS